MSETNKGYIYVRNHESYTKYNACKLGKASNIVERDGQYATSEIKRGYFDPVFQIPIEEMGRLEISLQREFNKLNIKFDGGIEFYDKKIIDSIEPYLISNGFDYIKISKEEMSNMTRPIRERNSINKVITTNKTGTEIVNYVPRDYQNKIIEESKIYFEKNEKGILVLMCGVGKTLISLWITQKLNAQRILIGVPNRLLLNQWREVICMIFKNIPYLIVCDDIKTEHVTQFLKEYNNNCIVITTYASSYKVYKATQEINFTFDMKINDECHHLTSNNIQEDDRKTYVQILKINSKKQLSLTATMKLLENKENSRDEDIVVSNDNVEYFGEIIDKKCLLWAIDQNIITDYVIQTIITDEEQLEQQLAKFNVAEENDKRLFLSAFASLKSIFEKHSHHLLIYSNNTENSKKIIRYINLLINDNYFDIPDLYCSDYQGEMNSKIQKDIIEKFTKSNYGIIACVYCLGEGWDFPLLDGVVFAENMTSNIRIVQSALRSGRKNNNELTKKNKIILPILNRDDWLENNENVDLKKVREVIYQMGMEDETIIQKIKVFKIDVKKQPNYNKKESNSPVYEFGDYDDELTQTLRLKTRGRFAINSISYEKAKKIIIENNIKTKEEYNELCERDYRLSKDPETIFGNNFTTWIDYLSIENIFYNIDKCKEKIKNYLSKHDELKKYYMNLSMVTNELCKKDSSFPPHDLWIEYYNLKSLEDIIIIKNNKKRSGLIL